MGKLELRETLSKHVGRVWNVAWHPKGDAFASCGEDKTIRIWAKEGNKWINKIVLADGHKRTIRSVAWSPCGNYLASASFDATTAVWDKKSGEFECNATLEGHENEVKSVAWSNSGSLLATCSRDKSVWVWEVAEEDEYECAAVLNAHTQDVKKVIWHPHCDLLASASYDNTIKLFKEDPTDKDWISVATLASHESTVWSIAFDKTGTRLASCSDDTTVKIWKEYRPNNPEGIPTSDNESTWKCVSTVSGLHTRTVYDISWCHLTGLIATACGDDTIRILQEDNDSDPNAPNFSCVSSTERSHSQDVNAVAWNPVISGLLASCSDDGNIKLWNYME
ncbi:hypothetical protein FQR65_LT06534 [Abscondita terminalis]|nr:hypothetical protein FQR65_LT06534 [Abscondita terminalis]